MMKTIIKTTLMLLALLLPATALAHDFEVDGIYYNINGNEAIVTYEGATSNLGNSYSGEVNIPSTVQYNSSNYLVTSIGYRAFLNCPDLTNVIIPNTVTTIEQSAFNGCSALTNIVIPNSVTSISGMAFQDCNNLEGVTIGNSVTSIGPYAFRRCSSLTSIDIPNSVTEMGSSPFSDCSSLVSVSIGNSLSSISSSTFTGCTGITSITIASDNQFYDSRDNCNAIIETATNTLIFGCQNTTIPSSVTAIGNNAFLKCTSLTVMTIPNSVITIGDYAFSGCTGLTSVVIGTSVTSIGERAFYNCNNLNYVECWAQNPPTINKNTFSPCYSQATLAIPIPEYNYQVNENWSQFSQIVPLSSEFEVDGIKYSMSWYGFESRTSVASYNAYSGDLVLPETVTYHGLTFTIERIGSKAFLNCTELTSVVIPNTVTDIYYMAFNGCTGLASLTIGTSVNVIYGEIDGEDYCFENCTNLKTLVWNARNCQDYRFASQTIAGIEQVTIGDEVESLPNNFLKDSKVKTLVIPESVTTIGNHAFSNCGLLESVDLPASLTVIGANAFFNDVSLADVTCNAINPPCVDNYDCFYPAYETAELHVPAASVEDYQQTEYWKNFNHITPIAALIIGDVDGDGQVGIADVTDLIDLILEGSIDILTNPAADVDGDGRIGIADVTEIIDRVLSGN